MTQKTTQRGLKKSLLNRIRGDVLMEDVHRSLYSTDASLYEIQPVGVVVPRDKNDVAETIRIAAEHGVTLLPRGGGTSLAGQTVGHSLVLDFSKYMNAILELNEGQRWVRVEPGLVRDELNEAIRGTGLHFTPDVATTNRANIGGMIGNNSAGTRSIVYGKTVDQVIDVNTILTSGEEVRFAPVDAETWAKKAALETHEGRIYRAVGAILDEHAEEIRKRFPKVMRRVGGYNLDELLDPKNRNLAKLICGSEGTLACITDATVRLEPVPLHSAMMIVHFNDLIESLKAVTPLLALNPSAVELLDRVIIELAVKNPHSRKAMRFLKGSPDALLLVEFFGSSEEAVSRKLEETETLLRREQRGYDFIPLLDPKEQGKIWEMRKAGLGIMLSMRGDFKPLPFIEDACIPPEHLPEYIARVVEIIHRHNRKVSMYAHASVGVLHVRPILNLKQHEDEEILKRITDAVFELVVSFGGSWSGEHGDGLIRSPYNERFFGAEIYNAFKRIKKVFDPDNRLNPGKIVEAGDLRENLRIGSGYQTASVDTYFRFAEDGGIARAVEMCSGVGACRKTLTGTMCPSYMVTRDEIHTTRGRANALRAVLSGKLGSADFSDSSLLEVFDLCVACKGCKAECPSNVDVAKLKYEVLAQHYKHSRIPIRARMFGRPDLLGRIGSPVAPVLNPLMRSRPGRLAAQAFFGIDRRRKLPAFSRRTFASWFRRHQRNEPGRAAAVVLFNDTYMNYYEPGIGVAAVTVLESLGFSVILADAGCCRRPQISAGLLKQARPAVDAVIDSLHVYAEQDLPIVVCEPSCFSAIRDDYLDFAGNGTRARRVSRATHLIDDFVHRHMPHKKARKSGKAPVLFHGHCHMKAVTGTAALKHAIRYYTKREVEEVDSGCCGMAGGFGYEKEHYDISKAMAERRLVVAISGKDSDVPIVANGFSCRHQIRDLANRRAVHAVQLLASEIKTPTR